MSGFSLRKAVAIVTTAALMSLPPAEAANFPYFRLKSPTGQTPDTVPPPPPPQEQIFLSFPNASNGMVGQYYNATAAVFGATGVVSYAVASGSLPKGLSLDHTTGVIAGVPSLAGTSNAVIEAFDNGTGTNANASLSITVNPSFMVSGAAPTIATVGNPYQARFLGSGGTAPYAFGTGSVLPPGLSLDSASGVLAGIPSRSGTYSSISITGQDASGSTARSTAFDIVVSDPLSIGWAAVPGRLGDAYSSSALTTGGHAPFNYVLTGSLPDGLTFSRTSGTVAGTPLTAGDFQVGISVLDVDGRSATTGLHTIHIVTSDFQRPLAISGSPATTAQVEVAYSAEFSAVGGSGTGFSYDLAGAGLPPGLSLSPDGKITGYPLATGTYPGIVVRVTDSEANTAVSSPLSIIVSPAPQLMISGNPDISAQAGKAYSSNFIALEGSGTGYTFTSIGAALPPGLTLTKISQAQAAISGTPTYVGVYSGLQIRVTDSVGHAADSPVFSITVQSPAAPALAIAGLASTHAAIGMPFQANLTAKGGTDAGFNFALVDGVLPLGLTLAADGGISGTPTTAQTSAFTVAVTDSVGDTARASFTLVIDPVLTFDGTPVTADQGASYQFDLRTITSGGRQPFTYTLLSGTLPIGMILDPSGTISSQGVSGTGSTAVVKATDADGQVVSATLTFSVNAAVAAVTPQVAKIVDGMMTTRSGNTLIAAISTNLDNPQWTFTQDPAAPAFSPSISNGVLTATVPTVNSQTPITITAKASNPYATATSQSFTINVLPVLSVSAQGSGSLEGVVGVPFTYGPYAASGLVGAPQFAAVSLYSDGSPNGAANLAAVCPGLTLNSTNGTISGVPSSPCALDIYMFLTDTYDGTSVTHGSEQTWPLYLDGSGEYYRWLPQRGPLIHITADTATASLTSPTTVRAGAAVAGTLSTNLVGASWTITTTPSDLALTVSGNSFSGVAPSTTIQKNYTITATALSGSYSVRSNAMVSVAPTLSIGDVSAISGNVGVSLTQTPAATATGVQGTATYELLQNGNHIDLATVCPGVTFDTATALVAGRPTAACIISSAQVRVQDTFDGAAANSPMFVISMSATSAPSGSYTANANIGTPYSSSLATPTGGATPYVWSLASGSLPAGLSVDPGSGTVSGTPTTSGTSSFTVKVTDANGISSPASTIQTIVVNAATANVSLTSPTSTRSGAAIAGTLSSSLPSPSWSFASTPPDLATALHGSGSSLSGTAPNVSSVTAFSNVIATASANGVQASSTPFSLTVAPALALSGGPSTDIVADTGTAITATSQVSAGSTALGALAYALTQSGNAVTLSSVCPGLSFNTSNGVITGNPTATCSQSNLKIRGTDTDGASAFTATAFAINVTTPPLAPTGTLPGATAGTAYSAALNPNGGRSPYSWTLASGTLPNGLTLNTSGTLSGTPNALGTFTFTLKYTDAAGVTSPASANQSITVGAASAIANLSTAPTVHPGRPVSGSLTTSMTTPTWSFPASPSTPVLNLAATSGTAFSGTAPTVQSQTTFTVTPTVTEPSGIYSKSGATFSFTVKPALAYSAQPSGTYSANVNVAMTATTQPTVTNLIGTASYQLLQNGGVVANSQTSLGGLCPGLGFSSTTGQISGTGSGACNVQKLAVRATDSNDGTYVDSSPTFTVAIVGPMSLTGVPPTGTAGQPYSFTPTVTGGLPPYTFSLANAGNPGVTGTFGLSLDYTTGTLSGTPTAGTATSPTIQVVDSTGATKSTAFPITINASASMPLTITSAPMNLTTYNNSPVYYSWVASGGKQPYTWSTNIGNTIAGETFGGGTPGASIAPPYSWYTAGPVGNYPFTVKVTDANGTNVTQANQLTLTNTSGVTPDIADGAVVNWAPGGSPTWNFKWVTVTNPPTMTVTGLTGTGLTAFSSGGSPWSIYGTISSNYGSYPITVTFAFPNGGGTYTYHYTLNIAHPISDSGITRNLFVNGVQATSGSGATEYGWTSSQTVQNAGDSIELVYSKPITSSAMPIKGAYNPSTASQDNSTWELFYGNGTTYTSCGTYDSYGTTFGANNGRAQCNDGTHTATNWKAVLRKTQASITSVQASNYGYFQ